MLTCLVDALFGEVGIATVKVLEHCGCEVVFDARQTCCGQPPFNAGDWNHARSIAQHCLSVFSPDLPIVCPSASCAAMLREGYRSLFSSAPLQDTRQRTQDSLSPQDPRPKTQDLPPNTECSTLNAQRSTPNTQYSILNARRAFELSEFLVHELGVESWPGARPYQKKIALHRACHSRALGLDNEAELLLASIPGLELLPFDQAEQCCGFGGAFCVTEPHLSSGIGLVKLKNIQASGAEELVSGDMGCLMHLQGLIDKHAIRLKTRHYAEVLAETISA